MRALRRRQDDRGSGSIEFVIIFPALLLLLLGLVAGGRLAHAHGAIEQAANDGARAASIHRTASAAKDSAIKAAQTTLANQGIHCTSMSVDLDTAGFAAGLGELATTTMTITCTVDLDDVAMPGVPGSQTITTRASSALDPYRSRSS